MKGIIGFLLKCFIAGTILVTGTAHANWVKIDNIKIDGVRNSLPAGQSIHRNYNGGGVYMVKLDPNSLGIALGKSQDSPRTISASVTVLVNTRTLGRYYSNGLNMDSGPQSFVINGPPGVSLGMEFFVEDPNASGNSGSVGLTVYQWK